MTQHICTRNFEGLTVRSIDLGHSSVEIWFTDGSVLRFEAETEGMDASTVHLTTSVEYE